MTTKILHFLLSTITLLLPLFSSAQSPVKAAYWNSVTEFPVTSIDSTLFTHLFCAFASLDPTTYTISIPPCFSSFTSTVQKSNPSILTLLSIGGGGRADSIAFSLMASKLSSRKSFINSSITLARANGFSGLDLDWEGDSWTAADMSNLDTLLSEWRVAIASESKTSNKTPLLLTAALAFSSSKDGLKYPVSSLRSNLDWVNVMDYDYYKPRRTAMTAAHAALFDPSGRRLSGSAGVADWMGAGLPASKIVLGLPYYGYAWALTDPNSHGLGAAATGPAKGFGIYAADGSIGFNSVRDFIANNKTTTVHEVYDATVVVNYCYAGATWIGYDDVDAIGAKVAFAKRKGLRGYFAWSVSADDTNRVLSKKALSTWG